MGSGEKHLMSFHFNLSQLLHHNHHHHHHNNHHNNHHSKNKDEIKGVPKGCMAIMVGHEGEEKLQRFIIPIMYVEHPLFIKLLKVAEEEYGFDQKGPITIPCYVDEFRRYKDLIDEEQHNNNNHHHHHHHQHHFNHHNQQNHHFLCFKA